jgi:hypothetical protein
MVQPSSSNTISLAISIHATTPRHNLSRYSPSSKLSMIEYFPNTADFPLPEVML